MRSGRLVFSMLLLMLFHGHWLMAQKKFSLSAEEAVQYALKHVTEIRNLEIDRDIQASKNRELIGQALPQVSGSASMMHYFSIPVTLLPDFISPAVYGVLNKEGVKDGSGNPIQSPNGSSQFFPARFGVPWQASAGFSFQQLLFQPDVFVGLQARTAVLKYNDINIDVMKDSVKSNVYRSYFSVLIAEKRKSFLDESVRRLEKLSKDQQKLFENGFAEKLDIDRTQVSLNNLKAAQNQVANLIEVGYASLKFALGLEQSDELVLTDQLSVTSIKRDILDTAGFKYEDRNEVKMLNKLVELQGLDLKRNKLSYAPTVAAYWNFNKSALRQEFDFFNRGPWFTASVAGLSINLPIFDGLQRYNRIKQARLNLEKVENTLKNVERAIDLQKTATYSIFKNSVMTLDVQERNLELAEKVYNSTKKKYEQGLGSSFEVLQTELSFQDAQSNYFQSLYDAMIARIGFNRALGRL